MEDTRKPTTVTTATTASASRYWQAYPSTSYNHEHRGGEAAVGTWTRQRQDQGERTGARATQEFARSMDHREEIRSTTRVRESPPLVPTMAHATVKRESVQVFEQRMSSHSLERKAPLTHSWTTSTSAHLQRNSYDLEPTRPHQWKREPIDRTHLVPPPRFQSRDLQAHQEHKVLVRPREEIFPRRAAATHHHDVDPQRGSEYWTGRAKQEPMTQTHPRVHEGRERSASSPRYLPAQRLLPSLMERRSLSSLSDTAISSPKLGGSPEIPPRLAHDHKGLFTQPRREFPIPRFSFPVDSPSLFSVLGSRERPTASADALVTGRATKLSARTSLVSTPAVTDSPPLPDPKKKGGKRCNVEGCDCRAQNRGLCWKHGGYTICTVDGCAKRAKSRGMCWSHGGGTQCKQDDCGKIAVSRGRCWAHGGGKRCKVPHCQKPAALRLDDFCSEHHSKSLRQAAPDLRQHHARIPARSADVDPSPRY